MLLLNAYINWMIDSEMLYLTEAITRGKMNNFQECRTSKNIIIYMSELCIIRWVGLVFGKTI